MGRPDLVELGHPETYELSPLYAEFPEREEDGKKIVQLYSDYRTIRDIIPNVHYDNNM